MNRGNAYDALGRSQDALREYGRAVAVKPDDRLIYVNRAITYYRTKEYAKARADIEKLQGPRRGPCPSSFSRTSRPPRRARGRGTGGK